MSKEYFNWVQAFTIFGVEIVIMDFQKFHTRERPRWKKSFNERKNETERKK